jgi:PhoH-like ATPase
MKKRKTFIIDTSVLLYDKASIHSFKCHDVILPIVVLDELDRFKDKKGLVGENARYINRFLDDLRQKGSLHKGICLDNNQTICVALDGFNNVPQGLDKDCADNKMISLALKLTKENKDKKVILVTKDINFRVKCDALGLLSEDYVKDRIINNSEELYRGYVDLEIKNSVLINEAYEQGNIPVSLVENLTSYKFCENEFVCIKSGQQSFLGYKKDKLIVPLLDKTELYDDFIGIQARSREQLYALNLLNNDDIPLVSLTGIAGSGKTFITLMTALAELGKEKYQRIVFTRNIQPVGRDIGFLPGTMDEKMMPWMSPMLDNFRSGIKDRDLTYFSTLYEKGKIEIAPLSFMRGRTFTDTFLILDEAQNASIHELKTVITRVGEGSKIVLLGDIGQIDTPYIDSLSNGLTIVAEKFKNQKLAGHITLKKGERSELATLASKIV